jgi:hypothetical protein
MRRMFGFLANLMLWLSLPLFGVLGYWEEHLVLTGSTRILIQLFILVVIFGWIYFWYSRAENEQLTHREIPRSVFDFGLTRGENPGFPENETREDAVSLAAFVPDSDSHPEIRRHDYVSHP